MSKSNTGEVNSSPPREKKSPGSNRKIRVRDGRIYYFYYTANVVAFCTENDLLYQILQDTALSPSMSSRVPGKIQFRKFDAVELKGHLLLSELCYACYSGRITSVETWVKELASFRHWMRNLHFEIDHADSNQLNCTKYNLSIMKHGTNKRKDNTTARIKQPTICYSGRYGNDYRIFAVWPGIKNRATGERDIVLKLKCRTAVDYMRCLHEIESLECGYGKPIAYMDESGNIRKVTSSKWKENRPCVTTACVESSVIGQEFLAWMFDCEFTPYKPREAKALFRKQMNG